MIPRIGFLKNILKKADETSLDYCNIKLLANSINQIHIMFLNGIIEQQQWIAFRQNAEGRLRSAGSFFGRPDADKQAIVSEKVNYHQPSWC